jgi:RNA methyltransferase, TrmH family
MEHPASAPISETLSLVRRLHSRAAREAAGLFYAEGFRAFIQLIKAGAPVERIVYCEVLARSPAVQKQVRLCRRAGVPVARVTPAQFRAVSTTDRASGIGAVLPQRWAPLAEIDPRRGLCWLAVGRIRSPGNLGTLLRTADAVGAGGVLFLGEDSDPFDPTVVRAGMGGLFHLQLVRTSVAAFAGWSRDHACTVIGTSPSAATPYTEVPVTPPLFLLLGEEREGLTPPELAACTHTASIPIRGHADSLNVGVAAGVMLYEVLRRSASGGEALASQFRRRPADGDCEAP